MTSNSSDLITKKDLHKMFWRSLPMEFSWHYERQMHMGFEFMMIPALRKIYDNDPEKFNDSLQRHLEFFNTSMYFSTFIAGIIISMEEMNARQGSFDTASISTMKVALMGPLAGIGDTIGWAMIPTIFGSIAASMGMEGNPLGIFLWAAFTFVFLVVRILQYEWGYGMGVNVITKFGKQITVFTEACSVLGLTVVGSLVATVVKLSTGLQFKNGDVVMKVQELIDGVMPALLQVAAVGIIYYFMKVKKVKMTWMILFIIVASMIGAATGIFTA